MVEIMVKTTFLKDVSKMAKDDVNLFRGTQLGNVPDGQQHSLSICDSTTAIVNPPANPLLFWGSGCLLA